MHAVSASHAHYASKSSSSMPSHKRASSGSFSLVSTSGSLRKTSSFVQSGGLWSAIEKSEFTMLDWLMESHDPSIDDSRAGIWFVLVHSRAFNGSLVVLILASCAMIGVNIDYGDNPETKVPFDVLEHFFTWIFVLEAIIKIGALSPAVYFGSGWDVFDFIVAAISAIGLVISFVSGTEGGDIPRVLRVFRLLRIGRVARTFQFFSELNNLLLGLLASLSGLFWAFVLLLVLIYVYALIFTEAVGKADIWIGRPEEEDVRAFYGTVPRSMYSLFQIMSLESWSMALARPVWEVQGWTVSLFVSYVLLSAFGILNLVIGLFSDKLMESSRSNRQRREQESLESRQRHRTQIIKSFKGMDTDDSNGISSDELRRAVHVYVQRQYSGGDDEHAADAAAFAKAAEYNMQAREELESEHCAIVDPLMKVGMPEDDGLGLEDILEESVSESGTSDDDDDSDAGDSKIGGTGAKEVRRGRDRRRSTELQRRIDHILGEGPAQAQQASQQVSVQQAAPTEPRRTVAPPLIPDSSGSLPPQTSSQAHLSLGAGQDVVQAESIGSAAVSTTQELELAAVTGTAQEASGPNGESSEKKIVAETAVSAAVVIATSGKQGSPGQARRQLAAGPGTGSSQGSPGLKPLAASKDVAPRVTRRQSSIAGEDGSDLESEKRQENMSELFRLLHVSEDVLLDISYLIENSDRRVLGSVLSQMDRKLFNVVDDMEEEQTLARYEGFAAQVQDVERAIRLVGIVPGGSEAAASAGADGSAGAGGFSSFSGTGAVGWRGPQSAAIAASDDAQGAPGTVSRAVVAGPAAGTGAAGSAAQGTGPGLGRSHSRGSSHGSGRHSRAMPIPVAPAATVPEAIQAAFRPTGDDGAPSVVEQLAGGAANQFDAALSDHHVHDIGHGRRASTAAHDLGLQGAGASRSGMGKGTAGGGAVVREDSEGGAHQLDPEERRRRIKALRMDYMPRILLQHPMHANDMQALSVKVLQTMMAARNYRTDRDLPYEFVTGLLLEINRSVELKDVLMLSAQLGKQSYEMQQLVRVVRAEQAAMFARSAHVARVEADRARERDSRGRARVEARMDRLESRLDSMESKLDRILEALAK